MNKDYIILDSNNNWLSTLKKITEKEAKEELKKFIKISKSKDNTYGDMEVGKDIYLYEVKEIYDN